MNIRKNIDEVKRTGPTILLSKQEILELDFKGIMRKVKWIVSKLIGFVVKRKSKELLVHKRIRLYQTPHQEQRRKEGETLFDKISGMRVS